jgi:hypothetical protein
MANIIESSDFATLEELALLCRNSIGESAKVIYVTNPNGQPLHLTVREERLTDGSFVCNAVIGR